MLSSNSCRRDVSLSRHEHLCAYLPASPAVLYSDMHALASRPHLGPLDSEMKNWMLRPLDESITSSLWAACLAGTHAVKVTGTGSAAGNILCECLSIVDPSEHGVAPQDDMLQDLDGMMSDPATAIKVLKEYGGADLHTVLD